uniref:De novo beta protein n=1 Tax=synthetic construct TaxID=32630 RepID=UPI000F044F53|nr:Chain A, De novo beta protein [synthetic construct]
TRETKVTVNPGEEYEVKVNPGTRVEIQAKGPAEFEGGGTRTRLNPGESYKFENLTSQPLRIRLRNLSDTPIEFRIREE